MESRTEVFRKNRSNLSVQGQSQKRCEFTLGTVKAPGLKTQRRVSEFASQTAGQYYNVMAVKKAAKYVDIRAARESEGRTQ